MINIIGYAAAGGTLLGFLLNARGKHLLAIIAWLIFDSLWVWYNIQIGNAPHNVMVFGIIAMNLYAIFNLYLRKRIFTFKDKLKHQRYETAQNDTNRLDESGSQREASSGWGL